jgi:hypothetical protein
VLLRPAEIALDPGPVRRVCGRDQVDQHQRALAFDQVAEPFLPVLVRVRDEVEDVVADLERRTDLEAEGDHGIEVHDPA